MAGYSKIYVAGGQGGYMGADGVNPISFMILVGDADRQWFQPNYIDRSIKPIGRIRKIIPVGPNHKDALLDACIAFCPRYFNSCPTLASVEAELQNEVGLDFNMSPDKIPSLWDQLREEARPVFAAMNIWQADLMPVELR